MEDREVWWLDFELLPLQPLWKSGQSREKIEILKLFTNEKIFVLLFKSFVFDAHVRQSSTSHVLSFSILANSCSTLAPKMCR